MSSKHLDEPIERGCLELRTYDVKCPICGKINRGLFLEETEGWMECDQCGNATRIRLAGENQLSMVYTVKKLEPHLKYC